MNFKDKKVLVTGGTKGIGKTVALAFASQGASVGVNYATDDQSASDLEKELQQMSSDYLLLKADVSSADEVETMIRQVLDQWERIDILVNNAGIIRDKMLLFLGEEDWDRVINTNLKGTYLCSRAVLKEMISQKSGRIINMASPSAITGRQAQTNYSASKGGIISFTKSLSKEVARIGITVNAICPGIIDTPMTQELKEATKKELLSMIPMGKFGKTDNVADGVLFLASEKAAYITGQVLAIDGGLT